MATLFFLENMNHNPHLYPHFVRIAKRVPPKGDLSDRVLRRANHKDFQGLV